MRITGMLQTNIRMYIILEGEMASVERLLQYQTLPQEDAYRTAAPSLVNLRKHAVAYHAQNAEACAKANVDSHVVSLPDVSEEVDTAADPTSLDMITSLPPVEAVFTPPPTLTDEDTIQAIAALAQSSASPAAARVHGWPWRGELVFRNVCMSYREDSPVILNNLSLDVPAGKKIGIVGRTGAGKSTLLLALFRMVGIRSGSISIDGVGTYSILLLSDVPFRVLWPLPINNFKSHVLRRYEAII